LEGRASALAGLIGRFEVPGPPYAIATARATTV